MNTTAPLLTLVNGEWNDTISATDRGLWYGDGVFRTFRLKHGTPEHWNIQYQCLARDAARLGIDCPSAQTWEADMAALYGRFFDQPSLIIRLMLTRGSGPRGYAPPTPACPMRVVQAFPEVLFNPLYQKEGIKMGVCRVRLAQQPLLAGIKHLNRLEQVLARREWQHSDWQEGLLLDTEGWVIEGSFSNLFLRRGHTLYTPQLDLSGVAGAMRECLLAHAGELGLHTKMTRLRLAEVLAADEVWCVNSLIGLWPVKELEGRYWTEFAWADRVLNHLLQSP